MDTIVLVVLVLEGLIIIVELVILIFMIKHIHKLGNYIRQLDEHLGQLRDYKRQFNEHPKKRSNK